MTKVLFTMRRLCLCMACILSIALSGCSADLWLTPDQQGQRLMQVEKYAEAAAVFTDVFRKGVAYYRAGNFEAANSAFSMVDSAAAHFNRGNSLILLGKYDDAIAAYGRAVELQPGWKEAEENRAIARIRAGRLKKKGGEGTGGMLGADEIVFDQSGQKNSGGPETVQINDQQPLSDEQLRSLWLRRVQTKPADFLRAKFAYQLSHRKN